MTQRELFINFLIEINKEESPSLHLAEFNHLANKAINNVYDNLFFTYSRNQKVRDYLKGVKRVTEINSLYKSMKGYSFDLPNDYRHLQKVEVFYKVLKPFGKCQKKGEEFSSVCKVLEPDQEGSVINDFFYSPNYRRTFSYNTPYYSLIQNACEILAGSNIGTELEITKVRLDYLKKPELINLTYEQAFDIEEDTSSLMEFDDITNNKILNELVKLVMERNGDPRLSNYMQVNTLNPLQDTLNEIR